jgi:NAD(P) transhydrogenase subunit alpha
LRVAVVKESNEYENRVAISPEIVKKIISLGAKVTIEKNAGLKSFFLDKDYQKIGAEIANNFKDTVKNADLILKIQTPSESELKELPKGSTLIGNFNDLKNNLKEYAKNHINTISLDLIPRITRAQSMDILSSQSNLAGYKSVVYATNKFSKSLPMMMTAAGTIPPAKVLILAVAIA